MSLGAAELSELSGEDSGADSGVDSEETAEETSEETSEDEELEEDWDPESSLPQAPRENTRIRAITADRTRKTVLFII